MSAKVYFSYFYLYQQFYNTSLQNYKGSDRLSVLSSPTFSQFFRRHVKATSSPSRSNGVTAAMCHSDG